MVILPGEGVIRRERRQMPPACAYDHNDIYYCLILRIKSSGDKGGSKRARRC
jgi:hypothetical protein